jgi:IclR family acetate operon transcriptional repressor
MISISQRKSSLPGKIFRDTEIRPAARCPVLDDGKDRRRARGRPRKSEEAATASVQSLDRALALLEVIAGRDGSSLVDLTEAAELPASTAHRILTTLAQRDFVRQEPETGLWTIGVGAFAVGQAFVRVRKIETLSRPAMRALMEETGETVNLGVLEGSEVVFLAQVECTAPIRAFFRPGRRGPAHASGIGKALLAEAPAEQVAALCAAPLARYTPATLTEPAALVATLAEIRARGWAMDDEEHTPGMRCVAAPVFDQHGAAIAAVSVSGPTVRMTREAAPHVAARAVAAADAVTRAIGGRRPR